MKKTNDLFVFLPEIIYTDLTVSKIQNHNYIFRHVWECMTLSLDLDSRFCTMLEAVKRCCEDVWASLEAKDSGCWHNRGIWKRPTRSSSLRRSRVWTSDGVRMCDGKIWLQKATQIRRSEICVEVLTCSGVAQGFRKTKICIFQEIRAFKFTVPHS